MESLQQYYEIKKYLSGIFINKQSSDSVATIFSDPTVAQFWEIGSLNVATVSKHDLDTAFPTIGLTETSTVATDC